MKKNRNIFWGILFLMIAAFIIASAMGLFGDIGFWTLAFIPFLAVWMLRSIAKLQWSGVLFSAAFLAILYDEMLGIEALTPWPVLLAALFGSIGLNIMFGKGVHWSIGRFVNDNKKMEDKVMNKMTEKGPYISFSYSSENEGENAGSHGGTEFFEEKEHSFKSDSSFSETTKYVTCQALRKASIDNSFGSSTIYFDGAKLENGKAVVSVENSFGNVTLYIPKEWRIMVDIDRSFGSCDIYGTCAVQSDNTLLVKGETSFGTVEVHFI